MHNGTICSISWHIVTPIKREKRFEELDFLAENFDSKTSIEIPWMKIFIIESQILIGNSCIIYVLLLLRVLLMRAAKFLLIRVCYMNLLGYMFEFCTICIFWLFNICYSANLVFIALYVLMNSYIESRIVGIIDPNSAILNWINCST